MPIRKGRLWKPCTKCGTMYPATTVKPGLCDNCNTKNNSFMRMLARKRARINDV